MRGAVGPPHKDMRRAVVLILTKDDEALSGPRMERIPDGDFRGRNQGIMSPFPTPVPTEPPPCIRSCRPQSSMT